MDARLVPAAARAVHLRRAAVQDRRDAALAAAAGRIAATPASGTAPSRRSRPGTAQTRAEEARAQAGT